VAADDGASPLGIMLGAILDGIPESVVIGISLLAGESVSIAVVAAVFLSNIPEAISSTPGLAARWAPGSPSPPGAGSWPRARWPPPRLLPAWWRPALADIGLQAFAAGAILVMLTDEMIPGAHAKGHTAAGLATGVRFAVAALLSFGTSCTADPGAPSAPFGPSTQRGLSRARLLRQIPKSNAPCASPPSRNSTNWSAASAAALLRLDDDLAQQRPALGAPRLDRLRLLGPRNVQLASQRRSGRA